MSKTDYTGDHVTTNFFKQCCYKCEDRHMGCHGTCEKYIEAKKKHDEYKTKVFEKETEEARMKGYLRNSARRMKTIPNLKQRRSARTAKYITDVKEKENGD